MPEAATAGHAVAKRTRAFKDLRSWQLGMLGAIAAFGAALVSTLLGTIWPLYLKALDADELISMPGVVVSVYLVGVAVAGIVFAAVAKRCGELL